MRTLNAVKGQTEKERERETVCDICIHDFMMVDMLYGHLFSLFSYYTHSHTYMYVSVCVYTYSYFISVKHLMSCRS